MNVLRSQIETRSRIRSVEPKSLMPDRFGKKTGPSCRTLSHLARDFFGVVHTVLKQAMKNAENQKQPISMTHLQHEFGVTKEMDQELQHFLISRTGGEALEVVHGAEPEPGLEQWRRLAALYDPLAAGRSLDDSRQILSPPKASEMDDLSHTIQAWESLEQRHWERTKDMRLAILFSMCPTDLESAKGCTSVNFPACSVCQKLGVHSQQLPTTAPQCDISSEGEGQPDEIPEEAALSSNSNDEEWWPNEVELNAVTIGNMSIDCKPVTTDGRRGRYREITVDSGAGESVVNPNDWPYVDLKSSQGSVKRTTIRGPWR